MSTTPLSTSEYALLSTLLGTVAAQFSHKSCTDYPLAPTDANKAIAAAAIERAGLSGDWGDDASWEDYVADVMEADDSVMTFMDWMADHVAARCRSLAEGAGAPVNAAELAVIAEMLAVALEDYDEAEGLGLVPDAIEESAANLDILAQISDKETRLRETCVPFPAVLMYFTERCTAAADQG